MRRGWSPESGGRVIYSDVMLGPFWARPGMAHGSESRESW